MKLPVLSLTILLFTACVSSERPPERWSGYEPLPLNKSSPLIPITPPNAQLPIITDQQFEVRKIPEVKAILPVPVVSK